MKVILISGKSRVGKDTLADYLIELCESNSIKVCKMQVSTYIKMYVTKYFGWDGSEETKPRELLQRLGTEVIRNKINPLFHVNRLIEDIEVLSHFFDVAIVSDVRMINEIEETKKRCINQSVYSINLRRNDGQVNLTSSEKAHITEIELDNYEKFDIIIDNDSTKEELKNKASKLFEEVILK